MILSSANKNMLIILFIFYPRNDIWVNMGIWLTGVFIPRLLNNPLPSFCLINLDFSKTLKTTHCDESIILPFFVFSTLRFYFPHFLISSFISSWFFNILFSKTNSSCLMFESIQALQIKDSLLYKLVLTILFYHPSFFPYLFPFTF